MAEAISPAGPSDDGADRLRSFFGYLFARHDPGAQMPPVPEELTEWARDTMLATFAGILLAGGKQWSAERREGPLQALPGAPSKAHAARALAEQQTQRLARIANAATKGGLRIGGIAAVFYSVQLATGVYRGQYDFRNTAWGGMAAGAVLGTSLHGVGMAARLRSAVLGAALGAAIGVPAGILQDKVAALLPPEQQERRRRRAAQTEAIIAGTLEPEIPTQGLHPDPAAAVIERLQASLAGSPTKQRAQPSSPGQAAQDAAPKAAWWKIWGGQA